ncbi:DNA adenine methylase [Ornithobacterium rhinotracheale]|uniref:DNA adenine methylase n=1 Tax=Ornithobacterium rhinotracheale TaxID=28251 RepID=UPI00129C7756|nr:DNA adenine methylase [Ornithobacterium rhinotracheale]MRJ11706.1 DNA adenine methylase [Ornithobacterium rhinotracheale]
MKRKEFKSAPLPFQGQKRNFVKHFKAALKDYPSNATYVDLFGGSGLLSHTVKCVHPEAKVVYNDFDNFQNRLKAIPETNKILEELRALNLKTPRGKIIKGEEKEKVLEVLKRADKRGFVDWITLSGSLKFSMNYGTELKHFTHDSLYNTIRKTNFDEASDYLAGIEVVSEDYRHLFQKYKDLDNVVFLADPPYLSTDTATYASDKYWKLTDYLEVLETLQGSNFFYFTSNKSQVVELCQWLETRTSENLNPFKYATCTAMTNRPSHNTAYQDIMYHYKKTNDE